MAETVNYVIQRGDLYCTLGCVAALLVFARWPHLRRFGLYLLPFALAMLSKAPASVFPLLLLLYVFFFEAATLAPATRWKRSALAALPSIAVTLALLAFQSAMTPKTFTPSELSATAYRMVQPLVWLRYTAALVLPLHLNVDTDLQPLHELNLASALGFLFVAALLVAIVLSARRRRLFPIAFGLLWFVLTQLPTSLYTLSEVENDHRMFFSFPGLMLATVWALALLCRRLLARRSRSATPSWPRRLAVALAALALAGYAFGTVRRNQVWRSDESLWADDVAKSPHNGRGLMIYGLTLMNAGDYKGALQTFTRALIYTPNYATLEINLGVDTGLLADQAQASVPQPAQASLTADAERHFQRAIQLAPADDNTHSYYGRWLLLHGRLPEAVTQLQTAIALNPQRQMQRDLLLQAYDLTGNAAAAHTLAQQTLAIIPDDPAALAILEGRPAAGAAPADALLNASLAAFRSGQFQASIDDARRALTLDPRSAIAWNNIGAGQAALAQYDDAIAAEQKALALDPNLTIAANNLRSYQQQRARQNHTGAPAGGAIDPMAQADAAVADSLALYRAGDFAASLAAARRAAALNPQSPEAWNNIAAANASLQHWDQAIAAARKAIALKPDFQLARNNLAWALAQKPPAHSKEPARPDPAQPLK